MNLQISEIEKDGDVKVDGSGSGGSIGTPGTKDVGGIGGARVGGALRGGRLAGACLEAGAETKDERACNSFASLSVSVSSWSRRTAWVCQTAPWRQCGHTVARSTC